MKLANIRFGLALLAPFLAWGFADGTSVQGASARAIAPRRMARIPSGIYRSQLRGPNDPKELLVKAYYLDIYPVVNSDFLDFVRANPSWRRSQVKRPFAEEGYLKNWAGDLELGSEAASNAPVTYVSWYAAKAYAAWKGKRLPTIAEWEYAAAASPARPEGENDPEFARQLLAWYAAPARARLPAVGRGDANYFGLHNMHDLGWEWVADFSAAPGAADGPRNSALDNDLFCGNGSQGALDPGNYPVFMRFAFRSSLKEEFTIHNLGFRCARDL